MIDNEQDEICIDVNEYRNMVRDCSGVSLMNAKYSFFYDETGNIRKFSLTQNGVNAFEGIDNDFILGGILFKGDVPPCDLDSLYSELNMKVSEIKCKTLAGKGSDFWSAIGKKPIYQFLRWLESSGLYIHYATINNIYYSIVDIVDSLFVTQPQFDFGPDWVLHLKASWYTFVMSHLDETLAIFYKYDYPNLAKINIKAFCDEISDCIQSFDENDFYLETFRQLLKTSGRNGQLPFIEDNTSLVLVKEYSSLRSTRCALYNNSTHHFDREDEAETSLNAMPFTMNGKPLKNYKFIDSKEDRLIQISDIWVGLLGKLFFMLDNSTSSTITSKFQKINDRQAECIRIINTLINRSDNLNSTLIQNCNSVDMVQHRDQLLNLLDDLLAERTECKYTAK